MLQDIQAMPKKRTREESGLDNNLGIELESCCLQNVGVDTPIIISDPSNVQKEGICGSIAKQNVHGEEIVDTIAAALLMFQKHGTRLQHAEALAADHCTLSNGILKISTMQPHEHTINNAMIASQTRHVFCDVPKVIPPPHLAHTVFPINPKAPCAMDVDTTQLITTSNRGAGALKTTEQFPQRLWAILSNPSNLHLVSWYSLYQPNDSFIIHDKEAFAENVLPTVFCHKNYASFQRALCFHSFSSKRIHVPASTKKKTVYYHPQWKRCNPVVSMSIKRDRKRNKGPAALLADNVGTTNTHPEVHVSSNGTASRSGTVYKGISSAISYKLAEFPDLHHHQSILSCQKNSRQAPSDFQLTPHTQEDNAILPTSHTPNVQRVGEFKEVSRQLKCRVSEVVTTSVESQQQRLDEEGRILLNRLKYLEDLQLQVRSTK
jgi:hypothetical protein